MESTKTCVRCKENKALALFVLDKRNPSGYAGYCRQCKAARERQTQQERYERRKEYLKAYSRNKVYDPDKARQSRSKHLEAHPEKRSCKVYFLVCEVTGKVFTAKTSNVKYSKEGSKIKAKLHLESYRLTDKYKQDLEAKRIKHSDKAGEKICVECGTKYTLIIGYSSTCCSKACSDIRKKKAHKQRKTHIKRAKKYGVMYVNIDPIKVFERDKWRCKLCGIRTPKKLRGTSHNNAPELDHILPLSLGGNHTYDNVQCSCKKCNYTKNNKVIGQIPLFAAHPRRGVKNL